MWFNIFVPMWFNIFYYTENSAQRFHIAVNSTIRFTLRKEEIKISGFFELNQ